jgi:hypothetical protein
VASKATNLACLAAFDPMVQPCVLKFLVGCLCTRALLALKDTGEHHEA